MHKKKTKDKEKEKFQTLWGTLGREEEASPGWGGERNALE